ncbi:hypothetical protein [Sphingobacterium sp. 1.A.4]|uniref:hypothetical protein n=1 Tax=Sphingobacterium sp. 1.A.4 TaxID=2044603 RepID=UPI00118193F0|nr:hypothetical protein [Sphingobacterium sp. 1.A.4]
MNSLCRAVLIGLFGLLVSCSEHNPESLFEDVFVYKNTLPNTVSIDFYRRNAGKVSIDIADSISVPGNFNRFNYTFSPSAHDSIAIKFNDGKKIVFKYDPNSFNWNLNAINYNIYKETHKIKGNLTTQFYTYTIDNRIYELAN